jgi:hypothetical protein
MAVDLTTVALTGAQKGAVSALTNGGQRIAALVNAITANTNATFGEAKTFVDALEVEQGLQGGRITAVESLIASSDTALDTLQEIVEYIKLNRSTLDALGIASIAGLETRLADIEASVTSGNSYTDTEIARVEGDIAVVDGRVDNIVAGSTVLPASALGSDADWGLV